jgi:tRNA pseudouridine55 synthase
MAQRALRRNIDGVLLLDKPVGLSSQQAVSRVRRLYNAAKAGHTGTLDPAAAGLLPVCFGEATKFAQMLLDADKAYHAWLRLGVTTTTGDAEGEVLACQPAVTDRMVVEQTLKRFVGEIQQVPPMYSALKRNGKPLYEYARAGIELPREPRNVFIYDLQVIVFEGNLLEISVQCSKGVYIRSLAVDIGEALGCGASLTALTRTGVGPLRLGDSQVCTLPKLESLAQEALAACLLPMDTLVASLPKLELDETSTRRLRAGQRLPRHTAGATGLARLYTVDGRFLGIVEVDQEGRVAAHRMLSTGAHDALQKT